MLTSIPALGFTAVLLTKFAFGFTNQTNVVPAGVVLGIIGGTVAICVGIGLMVAWRPAQARPLDVLRYE
jgi:hypothetical protein